MNEGLCGADYLEAASIANRKLKDKVMRLQHELKAARNELCLKCGSYKEAHLGACNDCKYRRGGEWSKDLED